MHSIYSFPLSQIPNELQALHVLNQVTRPFIRSAVLPSPLLILSVFAEEIAKLAHVVKIVFVLAPKESAKKDFYYDYALDQYSGLLIQYSLIHAGDLFHAEKVLNAIGAPKISPKRELGGFFETSKT